MLFRRFTHWVKTLANKRTLAEIAAEELAEAELEKLAALSAREYQDSIVSYNDARIKRLRKYINDITKDED